MKVLVVGAGAVGGWFGAKLSAGGHEVGFVARGAHGEAIRQHGLLVESPSGQVVGRGSVFSDTSEARDFAADLALVAVKASALDEVAAATGAALADGGVAIPLLNGLDSEEELARVIGRERVVGGVAQLAGERIGPGHVNLRAGGMMTIAPLDPPAWPRVRELAPQLDACFPCVAEEELPRVLWQKLLWNAPFNAVCALIRQPAGAVLAVEPLEQLVRDAMREVIQVAKSEGVELSEHSIDALMAVTAGMFKDTEPSMLQDVLASRRTETDILQGAVVRRGEARGIPTPIHRTLHALLSAVDRAAR
jgi:2-dehydropantoate 2-reductase